MNMKKLAILALALCMIAAVAITGTVAYFTDKDDADNVFLMGNIDIKLDDTFTSKTIVPDETTKTQKLVTVTNHGATDAWVRVHLAYPAALKDYQANSYNDMLHTNFPGSSFAPGLWSWQNVQTDGNGWTGNGTSNWNTYYTTIDGVEYMVDVATYRTPLKKGDTTGEVLSQIYLDKNIDDLVNKTEGTVTYYKPNFSTGNRDKNQVVAGKEWMAYELPTGTDMTTTSMIKVVVEGVQTSTTYTDAYAALNNAFGEIGDYSAFGGEAYAAPKNANTFSTEELKSNSGASDFAKTGLSSEL